MMTEEAFGIMHHASNAFIYLVVDGVIGNLVNLCFEHLIDHLTAGEVYRNGINTLVDKVIGGCINNGIAGEVADALQEIVLIWCGHESVLLCYLINSVFTYCYS